MENTLKKYLKIHKLNQYIMDSLKISYFMEMEFILILRIFLSIEDNFQQVRNKVMVN